MPPPRLRPRHLRLCSRPPLLHRRSLATSTTASSATPFPFPPPPPSSGFTQLTTRALLSLHGHDAAHYLQGLTTANIRPGAREGVYALFLSAQGRVLHDVFIYPAAHSRAFTAQLPGGGAAQEDPAFLVEVDAAEAPRLLKHLKRYRLRAKVDVRAVEDGEWAVWSAWNDAVADTTPDASVSASDLNYTSTATTIGCPDARAPGMGHRLVLPHNTTPASLSTSTSTCPSASASASSPSPSAPAATPLSAYTIRRMLRGVPEGQAELAREHALPLEGNADLAGGIDFRKGCYLGQELTIRTHHTGVVRKRVLPVVLYRAASGGEVGPATPPAVLAYDGEAAATLATPLATVQAGAGIVPAGTARGRSAGKWLAGVGNIGLALCRVETMSDVVLTAEAGASRGFRAEDEFRLVVSGESDDGGSGRAAGVVGQQQQEQGPGQPGELRVKAFVPEWMRAGIRVKKQNRRV